MTSGAILLIDGENFLHKVKDALKDDKNDPKRADISRIDLNFILDKSLKEYKISRKIFYAAKLHFNRETGNKSKELILQQRYLKTQLTKQGFEFIIGGNIRSQKVGNQTIFREKGVDVKIAVDMVSLAADKKATTIILCSSDSDLQPAIKEVRERNVEIVYLGFEMQPNKGLSYTTNRTILFRNSEIVEAVKNNLVK